MPLFPIHQARLLSPLVLSIALIASSIANAQDRTEFGSTIRSNAALVGILYDLKQNQARQPLPIEVKRYGKIVDEFIASDWDESVLNRYYRAPLPLYTTQIFIPLISASAAPQAFNVADVVKPMYWLIHYKGQVSAPESGDWRFWGYGEEVCSVAVNQKNVLLSNWREITTPSVGWKSPEKPGQAVASGHLKAGDWIHLKKDEVVDLDVLIGERAGGVFCAFLLIQKRGETYQMVNGQPVLPVFQLAPHKTSQPQAPAKGPVIATSAQVWKGVE